MNFLSQFTISQFDDQIKRENLKTQQLRKT